MRSTESDERAGRLGESTLAHAGAHCDSGSLSLTLRVRPARAQTRKSSFMPNTAAEPILVGALTVQFHVDADESGGSVSVFECDVPANARMPAPHSHDDFDETVFGLDGVTTFTVGGGRTDLNPGEALFIPRRVIHGFSNGGDVDARFLAVISPGLLGSGYFRDVADVLAADGPPDVEKIGEVMRRHGLTPAPPA
jgi:quercetin dioxygenase-like cupin family protein